MIEYEMVNLTGGSISHICTDVNPNFIAHFHYVIEFGYVMEGEIEYIIDGVKYTVCKGEAIAMMPNQVHSIRTPKSAKYKMIQILPDAIGSFLSEHKDTIPLCNKFIPSNTAIIDIPIIPIPNAYRVLAIGYYLVSDLCEQCGGWSERPRVSTIIEDMLIVAESNFTDDTSLKDIAERLNYNYTYISRKFKSVIGMSFNEYRNNCRINHACRLLKNTEMSITDIAYETGYSSIRSFNRNFMKYNELSPSQYRERTMDNVLLSTHRVPI